MIGLPPAEALRLFTDGIGDPWPRVPHSVYGAGSEVAFQDGPLLETANGKTSV